MHLVRFSTRHLQFWKEVLTFHDSQLPRYLRKIFFSRTLRSKQNFVVVFADRALSRPNLGWLRTVVIRSGWSCRCIRWTGNGRLLNWSCFKTENISPSNSPTMCKWECINLILMNSYFKLNLLYLLFLLVRNTYIKHLFKQISGRNLCSLVSSFAFLDSIKQEKMHLLKIKQQNPNKSNWRQAVEFSLHLCISSNNDIKFNLNCFQSKFSFRFRSPKRFQSQCSSRRMPSERPFTKRPLSFQESEATRYTLRSILPSDLPNNHSLWLQLQCLKWTHRLRRISLRPPPSRSRFSSDPKKVENRFC